MVFSEDIDFYMSISLKGLCSIYIFETAYYEAKSLKIQGAREYFDEFFNLGDQFFIFTFIATSILDFLDVIPGEIGIMYSILFL